MVRTQKMILLLSGIRMEVLLVEVLIRFEADGSS
jgi:hypothetical protein